MPAEPVHPRRRGRPKKFHEPSRSIAVTLPDSAIAALQAVDADVSRAIVRVLQTSVPGALRHAAELAKFGRYAVISVPSTRMIECEIGVELVPLAEGRALVSFDEELSIAQLELRVGDVLAEGDLQGEDRATFEALADILRCARRSKTVTMHSRRIIVLEYPQSPRRDE